MTRFNVFLACDPLTIGIDALQQICHQHTEYGLQETDRDTLLELLFATVIEPKLGVEQPCFIHGYPASQAALARRQLEADGQETAARFELYWRGIELANGYYELTDADEQLARMRSEISEREQHNKPWRQADERLIAALKHGFPDCAGVALGVDRLLMLLLNKQHIDEVLPFGGAYA